LLKQIQSKHHEKQYLCDTCEYQTVRHYALKAHEDTKVSDNPITNASIRQQSQSIYYEYKATIRGNLKNLQEYKHDCIRYYCDQCEYQTTENGSLKIHKQNKH
jgi:hypothetical protein